MGFVDDDKEQRHKGHDVLGHGKARHGGQRKSILGGGAKPAPSKWDDAQKWLIGLSGAAGGDRGGRHGEAATKPRNSNADDRRLLGSSSQNGRVSCSSIDGVLEYNYNILAMPSTVVRVDEGETKKVDCHGEEEEEEEHWKAINPVGDADPRAAQSTAALPARSICLRDMGTEMTPIASKEPSRTGTPLRATTPVMRSPISSRSSTPVRPPPVNRAAVAAAAAQVGNARGALEVPVPDHSSSGGRKGHPGVLEGLPDVEEGRSELAGNPSSLESRAVAWGEAERAKYTARYKREEVKIQAWENREKRKAEMEMKRTEIKAEQMKARAQERMANRLAATRRIAEEKRAGAESKLNEQAARTAERADYIRKTGHLPSSFFSFKLPSFCS